jgi:hypothetical protein
MKRRIVSEAGGPMPTEGGVDDAFLIERASATPRANVTGASVGPTSGAPVKAIQGPLALLQRWFNEVITDPGTVRDGAEHASGLMRELGAEQIESLIKPSRTLPAIERMHLYHYSYRARLIECLADDYPAVQYALGHEGFEALASRYIAAHPSSHPSLNFFGKKMPEFCLTQAAELENEQLISDLARLEWAMVEVLHAPLGESFPVERIGALEPADWPRVVLSASPSLRFHKFDYPVNAFLQAFREGKEPPLPEREPSATAIYRSGFTIWRMEFTKSMARVLSALLEGRPLGEAMGEAAGEEDAEPDAADVRIWFRDWIEGGFFESFALA